MLFAKWCLSGQIKKSEVGKTCGMMEARRGAYRVLVGKL
jgi:hypothetical protein